MVEAKMARRIAGALSVIWSDIDHPRGWRMLAAR
jgi:hypothetical protein